MACPALWDMIDGYFMRSDMIRDQQADSRVCKSPNPGAGGVACVYTDREKNISDSLFSFKMLPGEFVQKMLISCF